MKDEIAALHDYLHLCTPTHWYITNGLGICECGKFMDQMKDGSWMPCTGDVKLTVEERDMHRKKPELWMKICARNNIIVYGR